MNTVYVVQYTTVEHPFMHLIYAVTEDIEDAVILADSLQNDKNVHEAGYEEVVFYSSSIVEEEV